MRDCLGEDLMEDDFIVVEEDWFKDSLFFKCMMNFILDCEKIESRMVCEFGKRMCLYLLMKFWNICVLLLKERE